MKNLFVLPTDKPSRLIIYSKLLNEFRLINEPIEDWNHKRHIYITSDEEIKKGDWYLTNKNTLCKCLGADDKYVYSLEAGSSAKCKKIILTTDQDLIDDGVQAIDDEFLEWFVKNPSCEEVEIEESTLLNTSRTYLDINKYKIIIPKTTQQIIDEDFSGGLDMGQIIPKEEPKQETLEETSERILANNVDGLKDALQDDDLFYFYKDVIKFYGQEMAKWQQEQDKNKYSEEEVKQDKKLYSDLVDLLERLRPIYKEDSVSHFKCEKQRINIIEQFKNK